MRVNRWPVLFPAQYAAGIYVVLRVVVAKIAPRVRGFVSSIFYPAAVSVVKRSSRIVYGSLNDAAIIPYVHGVATVRLELDSNGHIHEITIPVKLVVPVFLLDILHYISRAFKRVKSRV